ncbi:MAG: hypothetical protein ABIM30_08060 [candidate division WOR-3 bacterium]
MAMPMTQVLTQDTALSWMPQIELMPVLQREVMDHYVNKTEISKGWRLEIFDGRKELVLHFGWEEFVRVSPNQRYFTVARPVASPEGRTMAYDVELRHVSNSVLARGRMSSLGSDGQESHDEFVPADDGLSILHVANLPFSGGLHFVFVKRQASRLVRQFEVDKSELAFWNSRLSYEPKQGMIVVSFTGRAAGSGVYQTYLQCYSPEGRLRWETVIDGQSVVSNIFISGFDGTIALVCRNMDTRTKNMFLLKKSGDLIQQFQVYSGGLYRISYFYNVLGRQYFLSCSDGEFFYVVDIQKGEIINDQDFCKYGGTTVTGIASYKEYIIVSHCAFLWERGLNKYVVKDQGLGIISLHTNNPMLYLPLNLSGSPFIFYTEKGLFLRERISDYYGVEGYEKNDINKFYKIILK